MSVRVELTPVEVEWIDSMGQGGWRSAAEARREATFEAMRHRTVGYVLADDDRFLLLAMSRGDEGDADSRLVNDTMQIPRVAILSVARLSAANSHDH